MRVKLTELAKRILLPISEAERASDVSEALCGPAMHAELLTTYPNWEFPSEETRAAKLERDSGLQHAAIKPFIADLKESIEFTRGFYIVLPESVSPTEARRVLSWIKRMVTPAIEFASEQEDEYEAE